MKPPRQLVTPKTAKRKLQEIFGKRFNIHHKHFPARAYRCSRLAKDYRNLPCQQVVIEVDAHNELHHVHRPDMQILPSHAEMKRQLNVCANSGCSSQGCTQPMLLVATDAEIVQADLPPRIVCVPLSAFM